MCPHPRLSWASALTPLLSHARLSCNLCDLPLPLVAGAITAERDSGQSCVKPVDESAKRCV